MDHLRLFHLLGIVTVFAMALTGCDDKGEETLDCRHEGRGCTVGFRCQMNGANQYECLEDRNMGRPVGNEDAGPASDLGLIQTDQGPPVDLDSSPNQADGGQGDSGLGDRDGAQPPLVDAAMLQPPDLGAHQMEGTGAWAPDAEVAVNPELCPPEDIVAPGCMDPIDDEAQAELCDGFDNDCDRRIDEGCTCKLGEVRRCFAGPPGRVNVGACRSGNQRCTTVEGQLVWGPCEGGISPSVEICDGLDNDCNGCQDEIFQCDPEGACPGPGDPRVPDAAPFRDYPLRGGDFYQGQAVSWRWSIEGGPCDGIVPGRSSFDLVGANRQDAVFTPRLSGSYQVTLVVTTADGEFRCTWIVNVIGPGLRVEMCYPESLNQDLDLYMMPARLAGPWYAPAINAYTPSTNACSWANCEAMLRSALQRVNWGYANTNIAECEGGPQGAQWRGIGSCANPRLDIDNNLVEGVGLPENINVDNPNDGDEFRIMIQNFTGAVARPVVNIYCGGQRLATFGAAPDIVPNFQGANGIFSIGAMWRVADVRVQVDNAGNTTGCEVNAVHPPGMNAGHDVTQGDPRY